MTFLANISKCCFCVYCTLYLDAKDSVDAFFKGSKYALGCGISSLLAIAVLIQPQTGISASKYQTFIQWLQMVTERINLTMHYSLPGNTDCTN